MESWDELSCQIDADRTYPELLQLARRLRKLRSQGNEPAGRGLAQARIALTGNYTLAFLKSPLEVYLAGRGILAEVFAGEFDNYRQELLATDSALYALKPDVVILALDHHAVQHWPDGGAATEEVQSAADRQIHDWKALWQEAHARCGASIIQTNIALPCERVLGHYEAETAWGAANYLRRLNQLLAHAAPGHASICDAEHLSGYVGKRTWFDEPAWYTSRQGLGFAAVPALAHSLAAIVAALRGKSRKCLVLDLDNTLWGGVVGDVGVEGLRLARGDAVGEAYVDFQQYCLQLKRRGVVLAVCSKNNPEIARAPFETHPEMVLKLDDISAFVANWDDKATNLRRIAAELNLGLDSLVLVDDNPAERALVRRYVPEVAVPEMPEDPALFRQALDRQRYFEVAALSEEDRARAGYYRTEQKRQSAALSASDFDAFLASLEQRCDTGPFDEMSLGRIVQLTNKTNQWNLATRRMTEAEVRLRMADPSYYTLWVRHGDRFGDSGLIAVLIAREDQAVLHVEQWLMSCRVIKRGIEDFVFNELLDEARRRGVAAIEGTYRPTAKNTMVSDLYETLGFDHVTTGEDGATRWRLDLSKNVCHRRHFINRRTNDPTTKLEEAA